MTTIFAFKERFKKTKAPESSNLVHLLKKALVMKLDLFNSKLSSLSESSTRAFQNLAEMDAKGLSQQLVDEALPHFHDFSLDEQLLVIFHAYKASKIGAIRALPESETFHPTVNDFLRAYELRVIGRFGEAFDLLSHLAFTSPRKIILYRYVSDLPEHSSIDQALPLMEAFLPHLEPHRRVVMQFNIGMYSLNQSRMAQAEKVLSDLQQDRAELSQFFFHWLKAAVCSQLGEHSQSVTHYKNSLNLSHNLPCRQSDIGTLAYSALRECFWTGQVSHAQHYFRIIDQASKTQTSGIGLDRHTLSAAILEFLEGRVLSALRRLKVLFSTEKYNRVHLQASFVYLWALTATNSGPELEAAVTKLRDIQESLANSKFHFDFKLFEIYAQFLNLKISPDTAHLKIIAFLQERSHLPQRFHLDWAKGMDLLFQPEAFDSLQGVQHFQSYPILQRIAVWILAQKEELKSPIFWRYIGSQTHDSVARKMAEYRLAQLTGDLKLFAQAAWELSQNGVLSWLATLNESQSPLTYEAAHQITTVEFALDLESRRVVALKDFETLENQPYLSELFLALAANKLKPQNKEALAEKLGHTPYDPLQHDPIIYNLIARLRDWIRKRSPEADIVSGPHGWKLSFQDRIFVLSDNIQQNRTAASLETPSTENLRHQWILKQLSGLPHLTRADLLRKFPIKKSTAANDFNELIKLGLIRRQGSGRGIYYTLTPKEKV